MDTQIFDHPQGGNFESNSSSCISSLLVSINANAVVKLVQERITSIFSQNDTCVTTEDRLFAEIICDLIVKQATGQCDYHTEQYLNDDEITSDEYSSSNGEDEKSAEASSSSSAYAPTPPKKKQMPVERRFSTINMQSIVAQRYGDTKVLERWTSLKGQRKSIERIKAVLEGGGTRRMKIQKVKEFTG